MWKIENNQLHFSRHYSQFMPYPNPVPLVEMDPQELYTNLRERKEDLRAATEDTYEDSLDSRRVISPIERSLATYEKKLEDIMPAIQSARRAKAEHEAQQSATPIEQDCLATEEVVYGFSKSLDGIIDKVLAESQTEVTSIPCTVAEFTGVTSEPEVNDARLKPSKDLGNNETRHQ